MEVLTFVLMGLITLAFIGYPIWSGSTGSAVIPAPQKAGPLSADGMRCQNCGRELDDDERFCAGCGTPAGLRCDGCGRALDGDEAFCPGCGKRTGSA